MRMYLLLTQSLIILGIFYDIKYFEKFLKISDETVLIIWLQLPNRVRSLNLRL